MSEDDNQRRPGGPQGLLQAWPWLVFPLLPLVIALGALHLLYGDDFAFAVPQEGTSCLLPSPSGFVASFISSTHREFVHFKGLLVYVSVGFLHTALCLLAVVYFVAQIRDLPAPLGRRAWQLVGLLLVILIFAGFLAAADKTALQLTYRNTCELLCKAQVAGHIVPRECHGGPPSRLLWLASVPTLAGMIAAVFAAAVASTAAGVFPKSSEEEWRAAFAERVRTVQRAFYLTSAVLVTSTVSIKLFLELPAALSADEATTVAIDSFANGMTGFWGTVFSLTLVMIFAPSAYFMLTAAQRHERMSETPSEVRAWLSEQVTASLPQQVGNLAAAMAPLLVGPIGTLFQRLVEMG